ncbi:hypothetical protein QA612_17470 [Evansella sp. AB-P1]|uniref:DUF6944 family repetitive protein n=1 Tax=Evansella sp. AB-P1 TaxID=3037653 RepID=UPI00241CB5C8|nr:hypothetical protein [Evansella sp. AB-P1]MDG5789252.1 hypothetical protein [Evansella sp. AB-P1]
MSNELQQLIGQWVALIGVIVAAIGHTKRLTNNEELNTELRLIGRGIQGSGNALQALGETEEPFVEIGNWIQATGAGTTSYAAFKRLIGEELESFNNEFLGSTLQALGANVSAIGKENKGSHPVRISGNIIQSLGNILQSIGVVFILATKKEKGEVLRVIGPWIQVFGIALQSIGATIDYEKEMENS